MRDAAMDELHAAKEHVAILDAALNLRSLDRTIRLYEQYPQQLVEELKKEGDSIYG